MAVRITGTDLISRSTNLASPSSNYTCIFWYKFDSVPSSPDYLSPFVIKKTDYSQYAGIFSLGDGTGSHELQASDGATSPTSPSSLLVAGTWYPVTYRRFSNSQNFYINNILIGNFTLNITGDTFNEMLMGYDGFSLTDIEITSFKEWNAALTIDEMTAEINSPSAAIKTANLVTFTPLVSDLLDISGNGNDWSATGTPTFVSDPSFPTNTSSTTATDVGTLPATVTVNFTFFVFTLWYKYTAITGDNVLGPFAYSADYTPELNVYNDSLVEMIYGTGQGNQAALFSVENIGDVYYFEIVPVSGATVPASLSFSLIRHTDVTAPIGSPCISNDADFSDDYDGPLALLDIGNDNTVLSFINPFPVGEFAAILPDGTLAQSTEDEDITTNEIKIFDSTYTLIATVTVPNGDCQNITSDLTTQFYFAYFHIHAIVRSLATDGTIGATVYDLGSTHAVRAMAVSPDNSILYYQLTNDSTIKRWDLNTNMAMSDFLAGFTNHTVIKDLLCLGDGSVITIDVTAGTCKRYDSSAALLNTYTLPLTIDPHALDRMCVGLDDTSFWLYLRGDVPNIPLHVVQVQVSDGTVLTDKSYDTFPGSVSFFNQTLPVSAMPTRFGPSSSCPIWIGRVAYTPPGGGGGTIVVGKGSNPLASGVTFTVDSPGASPTNFTIETEGTQILTVPAGTYSITEEPTTDYSPEYFVSNDPDNNDNTAIVVGAGDLVDVVIVNSLKTEFGGLYIMNPIIPQNLPAPPIPPDVFKTSDTVVAQDGTFVDKLIGWFFQTYLVRDK